MGDNYISINFPNFVTITLIAFVGMAIVGLAASALRSYTGTAAAA